MLTFWPGDTVHTTTVDAGGTDESGATRGLGDPETGPFYIETALPGDVLAVHIVRLKLNRDWAMSDDFVVPRAVDSDLAVKLKDTGKSVQWHLDRTQMSPWIPCSAALALPPGFASAAFGTSDSKLTPSEIAQFLEAATVFFGVTNDHNGRIGGKALGNLCSNCAARPLLIESAGLIFGVNYRG